MSNTDAPRAERYALTARVVTVHKGVTLSFRRNGAETPRGMAMPYTLGMWEDSKPVGIVLTEGTDTLSFTSRTEPTDLAIKHFTLSPLK